MSDKCEWNEARPNGVNYKAIDTSFLSSMDGDLCPAEMVDDWGRTRLCIRIPGHTGRHLALEFQCRYPTAVWQ